MNLEQAAKQNPLVYGISYIDLLESKKWEVASRQWSKEIYSAVNPFYIEQNPIGEARRLVVQKPTQIGMSVMGIVRMFHFADFWNVRVIYTLPRQQDVTDFVSTRIDPMIEKSARLKNLLGKPDSARAKRIRDSFLFFMEMSVEPRMMPADALMVDEVDLSDPTNISTALNRLDASPWKLTYYFSTPTLPEYGINALYQTSDMRDWFVKCGGCGSEFIMDWEKNLRVIGDLRNPEEVKYVCHKCDKELTHDIIQAGRWVAAFPSKSKDAVGYRASQMMTHSAPQLYSHFIDPQTKLFEFYRKRLGITYEIAGGEITREDFLKNSFDMRYHMETKPDGVSDYFIGVDQGNELQVIVSKIQPGDDKPIQVVKSEIVPFEEGFDRVEQLISVFSPKLVVIDADPNRHSVKKLQKVYPGLVIAADYAEIKEYYTKKDSDIAGRDIFTNVVISRTMAFDNLQSAIVGGQIKLPGFPGEKYLPEEVELIIDQCTAIKRDVVMSKRPSGEVPVGIWRNIRADHLAHAMSYMLIATKLARGDRKQFKFKIINGQDEVLSPKQAVEESQEPKKRSKIRVVF